MRHRVLAAQASRRGCISVSKNQPMEITPDAVWRHLDSLTKPPRSLGRLEELAHCLRVIQQTTDPRTKPRRLVLFAADHGVVASGVSAWPSDVTALVVQTILAGKAASTVLARESATETVLVNVGVRHEVTWNAAVSAATVRYRDARICAGTRNMAEEPALMVDEIRGPRTLDETKWAKRLKWGMQVVLVGEMGIGNTTSAACLAMLLANVPLLDAVGRGAGADDATMARKRKVVQASVERGRQIWKQDAIAAIASVAGLEIAAIAGFFIQRHNAGLTILLDGYMASARL